MMTSYTALAIVAIAAVPRGVGEAETGPETEDLLREGPQRLSHVSGAGPGAPASERVGELEGRSPSMQG
jgi:hypothetical protein